MFFFFAGLTFPKAKNSCLCYLEEQEPISIRWPCKFNATNEFNFIARSKHTKLGFWQALDTKIDKSFTYLQTSAQEWYSLCLACYFDLQSSQFWPALAMVDVVMTSAVPYFLSVFRFINLEINQGN